MFSVERYLDEYVEVLSQVDPATIEGLAHVLLGAWRSKRTVFCCGNGGSAMSACHLAADLTKLTAPMKGPRLRVQALTDSMAAVSAIANDLCYDDVFVEQLKSFLAPGDVLIAFSTSGSSRNVLKAVEYANRAGAVTVGITGCQGVKLHALAQRLVVVHSTSVQQIEDAAMVVGHLLCLRTKELVAHDAHELAVGEKPVVLHMVRAEDRPAV